MVSSCKSKHSLGVQYIGKAQPHRNEDKSINPSYIEQVAVKGKKTLPVLLFMQESVFFISLVVSISASPKGDRVCLIFRKQPTKQPTELWWKFCALSQQDCIGEWTDTTSRLKSSTWKQKFLVMQVHANDVLKHNFEIHLAGLPFFCMQNQI